MTTWHCDKCAQRFGTYADFGDHWRTDHRKDPITERIVSAWQDTPRPDDFTSSGVTEPWDAGSDAPF